MAGIAIALDLLKKSSALCSTKSVHNYGLCSATAVASAAAASVAAGSPFASRFLFGNPWLPVAHCDAGAVLSEDYISNIKSLSGSIFENDSLKYTTKHYDIELKPIFSAFGIKQFAVTALRSFLLFYLPLLEPRAVMDEDEDDFLQEIEEDAPVDLVVPFKKSVKQIIRETTVVTTRRVLERITVHYASQRMAWKLLKDVPKSAMRKAARGMPTIVYLFNVGRTTFRGHLLAVAASWIIQVGIEVYRFFSRLIKAKEEDDNVDKAAEVHLLGKKVSAVTVRCCSSLVFASVGAGIGATLFRPSIGQWIGCAAGDFAGPIILSIFVQKTLHSDL